MKAKKWLRRIHEVAMAELDDNREADARVLDLVSEALSDTLKPIGEVETPRGVVPDVHPDEFRDDFMDLPPRVRVEPMVDRPPLVLEEVEPTKAAHDPYGVRAAHEQAVKAAVGNKVVRGDAEDLARAAESYLAEAGFPGRKVSVQLWVGEPGGGCAVTIVRL